jgi:lysophospholipase L1-like esterase
VEAVALNPPAGSSVVLTLFNLDLEIETDSMVATESGGNLYSAQFLAVDNGEYEITAVLNDAADAALNADINTVVGVGGDYIIAVGDSIVNGVADEDPGNNDSLDGRIVAIQGSAAPLNDALTATLDLPHIVFNEGLPRDQATLLAGFPLLEDGRIDSKLERHPGADTMLLLIGTNDSSAGSSGTPADDFETSVRAIATAALDAGIDRVYIARIPPRYDNDSATNAVNNGRITEYNDRIVLIATEFSDDNVFLGPNFYTLFEEDKDNLYDLDGLHPNDAGYLAMADAWHTTLTTTP